ncbi:hypothetical protein AZE42_03118 [Rhizopogon vesiculosus]|uniref:Uncharacterized protein n=1 Tax=Rhizopogon vesiculosus TaxID=180088 RepID=A0A1J8QIM9_9AGAM|nr:hypothetical protein AZE42_03118 [Rhizopogon vesiculosus]
MSTMDMVADDDIDTETLQAQINMSMSFAEDLVSSWIKPAHKANLGKSTVDAQKLLDEQLRRPPRLGVGAPIPESSTSARDAARLKHQLIGKGKKRAPEDETSIKLGHHSEEEERRGGTVKKKMKLDPFAGRSKTKAKFDANSVPQSTRNPSSPRRQVDGRDSKTGADDQEQDLDGQSMSSSLVPSIIDADSSTKKKRRKHCVTGREADMSFQEKAILQSPQTSQAITTLEQCSSNRSLTTDTPPLIGSSSSSVSFSISGPFSSALQPDVKRHGELNVPDMSTKHPVPPLPAPQSTEGLRLSVPLLNLDGPPARRDEPGKDDNPGSPKKKRKRRKKKKHPIKVDG